MRFIGLISFLPILAFAAPLRNQDQKSLVIRSTETFENREVAILEERDDPNTIITKVDAYIVSHAKGIPLLNSANLIGVGSIETSKYYLDCCLRRDSQYPQSRHPGSHGGIFRSPSVSSPNHQTLQPLNRTLICMNSASLFLPFALQN